MLARGATLLLCTDGLVERRTASIAEGVQDLATVGASFADAHLEELCDLVLDRLGQHREDDIALLAARVL